MSSRGNFRKNWVALWLVWVGALAADSVSAEQKDYRGHHLVSIRLANETEIQTLLTLEAADLDFDIWSEGVGVGEVVARISPAQRIALDASGLTYRILVQDVQTLMVAERSGAAGFYDDYRTNDEINARINALVLQYPAIASAANFGTSVENRPITGIRISGAGQNKPGVLIHGCQHAREWLTPQTVLYVAEYLLSTYASNSNTQRLVDNIDWYLLPVMNPDGYEYTWTNDRLWRKNRSPKFGVDLNRNWGYEWGGKGSSGSPQSDLYRGPSPFSEPETLALRDFLLANQHVRGHADLHTFGTLLMWPWAHTSIPSPDNQTFEGFAEVMQGQADAIHGLRYLLGPVYTTIYPASGGAVDWSYGDAERWAITMELRGDGFVQPASQIILAAQENLPALLYFGSWIAACDPALQGTELSRAGEFPDCDDNGTPDICEIANETNADCNHNLASDACDLSSGLSENCNANPIPDECEPDEDCNANVQRDLCELVASPELDCNENWLMDQCESGDCNNNSVADICDLMTIGDCNHNNIPDDCDPNEDCNGNQITDICEIGITPELDCDQNNRLDACESGDCNNNARPDNCDIVLLGDCNANGVPDDCDAGTTSIDRNHDNYPDECQGACCLCGPCTVLRADVCAERGGIYGGPGVFCSDPGACTSPVFAHDQCGAAYDIPSAPRFAVDFDNRCADWDLPYEVPCPAMQPFGTDLWYSFIAPCNGVVRISTCSSTDFDTVLAIYNGGTRCDCPGNNNSLLDCADDTCGIPGGPGEMDRDMLAGNCYLVRVGGWDGAVGPGILELQYLSECNPTDLNSDGATNLRDFALFETCFGFVRDGCYGSDVNRDGRVDLSDYRAFRAMLGY